ncbi:hypothetical protein [Melaminivora jejuensis]|uniref:hypothetical protein n=1 Tax=Melaminivora jejuensis TaxID=1267217 RepID=UPI001AE0E848|nr:hypothetical protein [Melaminivora jejuensis]
MPASSDLFDQWAAALRPSAAAADDGEPAPQPRAAPAPATPSPCAAPCRSF